MRRVGLVAPAPSGVARGPSPCGELVGVVPTQAQSGASPAAGPDREIEPRWPAVVSVLIAMALYASLPGEIISGSHATTVFRILVPVLELALLIPLAIAAPHRHVYESGKRRMASIALTAIVTAANIAALCFLIHFLVTGGSSVHGKQLLLGGAQIWWTNVIVFALWFWELDGGGPPARLREPKAARDFAFIQMTDPEVSRRNWRPRFFDYFYVSFTNASAFSPTDTMPLTLHAKQLMLVESAISLLTLLLVAARAVNILS
jgi:uncharacterized membrane protein